MLTRILLIALLLTAVALVGCEKKQPTVGQQIDQAANQAQPAAADTQKAADKAAADASCLSN
jgi:hypothetical protein